MDNAAAINSETVERTAKDKRALLEALKEMPIVQVACKRANVSRATYYRWRNEDKRFRKESEDALSQGNEFINDMSESQIVTLIKEKKMPAIALWLKHHHPRYGAKVGQYVPISSDDDLTDEEKQMMAEALALASGKPIRKSNRIHGRNNA